MITRDILKYVTKIVLSSIVAVFAFIGAAHVALVIITRICG